MRTAYICVTTLTALLGVSCVQVQYDRKRLEVPRSPNALASLVVGTSSLEDALGALGAPLEVWALPEDALALAYGSSEIRQWVWQVSLPVFQNADARLNYDDKAARVEGHVLFFDRERRLTLMKSGLLKDLARDAQRVRPVALDT